ncbi:MAG: nucleotidyl transferase AbiEii/AbiGii toxin family protein [Spirochaetaceae bacterium]|nr:nucleotidyl transferase AbiEii/AbiGii toxin family protein [Spirochaetaceae bacterium]
MMQYSQYYEESLYPFQDKVLTILKDCGLPFYLTGGTAVSRGYLNHRYSDDLDFFVNNDTSFQAHVEKAVSAFVTAGFSIDFSESSSIYFTRLFLDRNKSGLNKNGLKIDFVNDIDVHFGDIKSTDVYYKTDSLRNILSNKYTALYRISVKDVIDICEISKNMSFNWKDIIDEANQKEAGTDLKEVVQIFASFGDDILESAKWVKTPDMEQLRKTISTVAFDMLNQQKNSLCS